jgi:hypothetical protein
MPNRGFLQAPQPMSEAEKLAQQAMQKMQRPTMLRNPRMTMEFRDRNRNGIDDREEGMFKPGDLVPIPESGSVQDGPDDSFSGIVMTPEGPRRVGAGAITGREMGQPEEFTQEDQETLERLLQQEAALESAPLGQLAQELRGQGMEEDTELAHLRLGEVVLPNQFLDDDKFASIVDEKFKEAGVDAEDFVVGGINPLLKPDRYNPATGLQQFFLKKLAKGLKKVVKKVAPYAGLIAAPFTGGASAMLIGGIGGAIGGGGIKGALKGAALGGAGSALFGGAGGAGGGISKFFNPAQGAKGIAGGNLGPSIRRGIGGLFKTPDFNPASGEISGGGIFGRAKEFILPGQDQRGLLQNLGIGGQQQQLYDAQGKPVQQRGGFLSNILGGGAGGAGGGFGNFAKLAGIGALSAGLGKLAFEDAKKQKGVALTPLTTMSPTGRYNIEAEIARRMGQARPNPVEFGLLPEGTLPQLSGGQPRMASLGGAIEELEGGMARGMMRGGGVMAFAQGGAVAMQEGGEMDPSQFPRMDGDINGPGTEQSDDIPAMLSDGEFVMTARAVRGAGSYEMQTEPGGIINLVPSLEEDRERGMDVMYKVMDTFSGQANPS